MEWGDGGMEIWNEVQFGPIFQSSKILFYPLKILMTFNLAPTWNQHLNLNIKIKLKFNLILELD